MIQCSNLSESITKSYKLAMKPIKKKKRIEIKKVIGYVIASFLVLLITVQTAFASPITPENILGLINKERVANGLNELQVNYELNRAASMKSRDMVKRNYFEHYAFGITPWDFIRNSGYDYQFAGENLAMSFNTSEGMVRAWMNSPTHRDNILDTNFSDTGIGIVKGVYTEDGVTRQTTVVTNMFGKKKTPIINIIEKIKEVFVLY